MTKIPVVNAPLSLPANFSIHAALSQGMLSHNTLVNAVNGKTLSVPTTVANLLSIGVLNPSMPASSIGVAHFGGD
jgi:hypothetical protein